MPFHIMFILFIMAALDVILFIPFIPANLRPFGC